MLSMTVVVFAIKLVNPSELTLYRRQTTIGLALFISMIHASEITEGTDTFLSNIIGAIWKLKDFFLITIAILMAFSTRYKLRHPDKTFAEGLLNKY